MKTTTTHRTEAALASRETVASEESWVEESLECWLDAQLADLEARHASFVTRKSLARYFSGKDSDR